MNRTCKVCCLVTCLIAGGYSAPAALPSLSVSLVPPASIQVSWPSNFTTGIWQLLYTTNLVSANWQPLPQTPVASGDTLGVLVPLNDSSGFFRLQEIGGTTGGCFFLATPPVINSGSSSLLTWCSQADTSYSVSPGPGSVTGGSLPVSPTSTTIYSLISSNASGLITNFATVIVNPCGWLQIKNWAAKMYFDYFDAASTANYNFSIKHRVGLTDDITFRLIPQAGSTATDAYYFGFATGGQVSMDDREDDKTGPNVFTTTEVGSGSPALNVSYVSLHLTCTNYDFSYSILMNTTETSSFGVTTSLDGLGAGAIKRALQESTNHITGSDFIPAQYPPSSSEYFSPDSDLGKAAFSTGVLPSASGLGPLVQWDFEPVP